MTRSDYTATLLVSQTPEEAFKAINNVRSWWTIMFEGNSEKLNDVFTVRFGETFITMKVIEFIPNQKVLWHVTDCHKHWLENKKEWVDTKICWEISGEKDATQIRLTHIGLVPGLECYNGCENAWNGYIKGSLFKLITEGKGMPDLK